MKKETINILFIEDSPTYALIIKEILSDANLSNTLDPRFNLVHVDNLSAGLKTLSARRTDIILLDLSLPDSQGIDTITRTQNHAPNIPIVLLTSSDDQILGVKAIQEGAQDYLQKGQVNKHSLVRSIQYALERQRWILQEIHQREQEARERSSMERISSISQTSITAQTYGVLPLRKSAPEYFNGLVQHYQKLLDLTLEQRVLRVDHNVGDSLNLLAEQLGRVKAGPRDVIDIHVHSIKILSQGIPPQKVQAYTEEGRLLVLELMGNLVSFYRNYYPGRNQDLAEADGQES